jgi:hypothetical protein
VDVLDEMEEDEDVADSGEGGRFVEEDVTTDDQGIIEGKMTLEPCSNDI